MSMCMRKDIVFYYYLLAKGPLRGPAHPVVFLKIEGDKIGIKTWSWICIEYGHVMIEDKLKSKFTNSIEYGHIMSDDKF